MRSLKALCVLCASIVAGCSSVGGGPAVGATAFAIDAKKTLIQPAFLYIESMGSYGNFEVLGRTEKNAMKWMSSTNCKKRVDFVFNSYNSQGSSYTAYGNRMGTCRYIVTNPKSQKGTMTVQVSSD